jgi:hypothetical protein
MRRTTPVRSRAWRWAALAAAATVVTAGCSSSSSSTSSTSTSTSSPSRPAPCQTSQLRGSFTDEQGSTGHYHATLVFTNTTTTACTIAGYPALQMLGPAHQPITTSVSPDPSLGAPTPVILAPAHRASTPLTWVEIPAGEPCVMPQQVQVTPPGNLEPLLLTWPPEHNLVCSPNIQAGAITAGLPLD